MRADPSMDVFEEFLSRYGEQFVTAGIDHAFSPALGGEFEYALESAVYYSVESGVVIAPDMLDKILDLFSPGSNPGECLRSFLKEHRPDYVRASEDQ